MQSLTRSLNRVAIAAAVTIGCMGMPGCIGLPRGRQSESPAKALVSAPKPQPTNAASPVRPVPATTPAQSDIQPVVHFDDETDVVASLPAVPEHDKNEAVDQGVIYEVPPMVVIDESAPANGVAIDLPQALALVSGQSPRIGLAVARHREAYAQLRIARTLWLPTIQAGFSYHHHDGVYQASNGAVVNVHRSSYQGGLGSQATGAGTTPAPGVVAQFHTSDALFQPKIAAHATSARNQAVRSVTNDTLLDTALAHLELLRAAQQLEITRETRDNAQHLANLTDSFADAGKGSQADADRAQTELVLRRNNLMRAEESMRVAGARLAELLSVDPSVAIVPAEVTVVPIDLLPDLPVSELVATGLSNRPELSEAKHLVCEAVYRYRREKYAPLVPSVLLGVSQTAFGGGLGGDLSNSRRRFDVDASVVWQVRNLGLGELARRDETRARYSQMRAIQASTMDRVAREVVEAHAAVSSRRAQIAVAESGISHAANAHRRSLDRIRDGMGLPLEALQSLQALHDARTEYLRAVVDFNEAQFRLHRAIGFPVNL